ncbi:type II toxin-antitoxin system VapC family toxin [Solwaraspora sp. WMMD792]|uniref:type II toxin-antitoxin system VapC family toxin n=1 Tax=Solwaraspora sp. WMMD792 TaxID=3016099 RepID=UPI00241600DB|nr:type II toxin-antitoxin system VapC family toxin [Solwaraspora sp. WMMD792]MDG4772166.1 type II toxin-antitoxin system VapC family toxin [Solwaraspora sp. WMMD792]
MSFIVLDTDVASASFLGRLPATFSARLVASSACISFVTLGELTKWTAIRSWGPRRRASLETWRRRILVLGFDERVATTWGQLQAHAQLRGRPRPVNDTWIAACCLVQGLPLATFNTKDFIDFAEYDGLELVDVS